MLPVEVAEIRDCAADNGVDVHVGPHSQTISKLSIEFIVSSVGIGVVEKVSATGIFGITFLVVVENDSASLVG